MRTTSAVAIGGPILIRSFATSSKGAESASPADEGVVSPEEEAEVLAKMFANPIKQEPSRARQANEVLARWYGP
jgi:hypothetical protein